MESYNAVEILWNGELLALYVVSESGNLLELESIRQAVRKEVSNYFGFDIAYELPFHFKTIGDIDLHFAQNGFDVELVEVG
jgi:hypothetical protein